MFNENSILNSSNDHIYRSIPPLIKQLRAAFSIDLVGLSYWRTLKQVHKFFSHKANTGNLRICSQRMFPRRVVTALKLTKNVLYVGLILFLSFTFSCLSDTWILTGIHDKVPTVVVKERHIAAVQGTFTATKDIVNYSVKRIIQQERNKTDHFSRVSLKRFVRPSSCDGCFNTNNSVFIQERNETKHFSEVSFKRFVRPNSCDGCFNTNYSVVIQERNKTKHFSGISLKRFVRANSCDGCFNTNYSVVIDNKEVCAVHKGRRVVLTAFVTSALHERGARDAVRDTWASCSKNNTSNDLRYLFVLGLGRNETVNDMIRTESNVFKDIVVYNFLDTYETLTLKTVLGLKHVTLVCSNSKFVMKVDSDVYVNIPAVLQLLKTQENNEDIKDEKRAETDFVSHYAKHSHEVPVIADKTKKLTVNGDVYVPLKYVEFSRKQANNGMFGLLWQESVPIRNRTSLFHKWFVTRAEYPDPVYPNYLDGLGYILPANVAKMVVSVSPNVPFFKFEDVYIGLCMRKAGYKLQETNGFLRLGTAVTLCSHKYDHIYLVHGVSPDRLRQAWAAKCRKTGFVQLETTVPLNRWIKLSSGNGTESEGSDLNSVIT